MLNMIFWTAFGALVGWIIAILQDATKRRTLVYALLGSVGGLAGGYVGGILNYSSADYEASATAMMFAVFGALVLVFLAGRATDNHSE